MKEIIFYGGEKAGMIALLALLGMNIRPKVVAEDSIVLVTAQLFDLETIMLHDIESFDLLICCHGRKIIKNDILKKGICINIHPCLYKYKGAKPIDRLIADGNSLASVGCHYMIEKVDSSAVIYEYFTTVKLDSVLSVYNQLYPIYATVLVTSVKKIIEGMKECHT